MSEQSKHFEKSEIPAVTAEEKQVLTKEDSKADISQSVKNFKKANDKVILKIYADYEVRQTEKANVFLIDLLVGKFSDLLG